MRGRNGVVSMAFVLLPFYPSMLTACRHHYYYKRFIPPSFLLPPPGSSMLTVCPFFPR